MATALPQIGLNFGSGDRVRDAYRSKRWTCKENVKRKNFEVSQTKDGEECIPLKKGKIGFWDGKMRFN